MKKFTIILILFKCCLILAQLTEIQDTISLPECTEGPEEGTKGQESSGVGQTCRRKPTTEATTTDKDPIPMVTMEAYQRLFPQENNPDLLTYVDHSFYRSAVVYNKLYFDEYWKNITNGTNKIIVHPILKNVILRHAYRDFSLQMRLPFEFPFYGHYLKDITVSTGGYLFTGLSSHHWFYQDQNISPLMANFDVSLDNSSAVVLYEDATRVTIVWENMRIREKPDIKYTFAATLYKNGDIFFAYKDIPTKLQSVNTKIYAYFIGIADSYFLNEVHHYVRMKTIHNYSRIPFNAYSIKSGSVLKLIALPSCPIYNTCKACTDHEAKYGSFKCMWCKSLGKCTSGADYFRPYLADCPFIDSCNSTDENNEVLPRQGYFKRVYNFAM